MTGSPASPSVQIPRDCENLAQTVPPPAAKLDQDPRVALMRTRTSLKNANNNLTATRACQQAQRERFATGL